MNDPSKYGYIPYHIRASDNVWDGIETIYVSLRSYDMVIIETQDDFISI
jgi:hypothetical protein